MRRRRWLRATDRCRGHGAARGDGAGVAIVRLQAETAAAEFFATGGEGGASHVACETPSADTPGVVFYCYGVNGAGAPLVAQATINDYGTVEITALDSGSTATTTAPTTTSPVLSAAQGSGSQVVQVNPVSGPAIVAVTHDGAGAFAVQPQQGGVPLGGPLVSVTGGWSGRYLVGLGGTITAFDVVADGDWTLTVQQRGTALVFDAVAGVAGENPDVVAYSDAAAVVTVARLRRQRTDRRACRHRHRRTRIWSTRTAHSPDRSRCPPAPASSPSMPPVGGRSQPPAATPTTPPPNLRSQHVS